MALKMMLSMNKCGELLIIKEIYFYYKFSLMISFTGGFTITQYYYMSLSLEIEHFLSE